MYKQVTQLSSITIEGGFIYFFFVHNFMQQMFEFCSESELLL